jgi:hypothetical protein
MRLSQDATDRADDPARIRIKYQLTAVADIGAAPVAA